MLVAGVVAFGAGCAVAVGLIYCLMIRMPLAQPFYSLAFPLERVFSKFTDRLGVPAHVLCMGLSWGVVAAMFFCCRKTALRIAIVALYVGLGVQQCIYYLP